ncbi:MAG: glycosyltransferase [Chitinivibrionales bacterium]|nr:glycosyltransferase [Chitinivibrionales bacterium]MBD3356579.1 glycosyltransferase [Chitinivibrionales bacterium]
MFVPAYNVAAHIESVIERIPKPVWEKVIRCWIIDDGSHDGTRKVIESIAADNPKIEPVLFEKNRGYGAVVREGLRRSRKTGAATAVCLHGDGQYPPESIPPFMEAMVAEGYDILQGSRIASGTALRGGMPLYKFVAGKILTFFENIVFGLKMTDYHSGYLFYSRNALLRIPFDWLSGSFDFDLEVIACARARGMRVGERPIPTRYAGEVSNLNPFSYGLRVVGVMLKYLAGTYRRL